MFCKCFPERRIDYHHKNHSDGHAGYRAKRGSRSAPCRSQKIIALGLRQSQTIPEHNTGAYNGQNRIDDLLDDLRYRSRHHIGVALEKSAECTGNGKNKNRGRQNPKSVFRVLNI